MRATALAVACAMCLACSATDLVGGGGTTYSGPFSGQLSRSTAGQGNSGGGVISCVNTYTLSGTLSMTLTQSGTAVAGSGSLNGAETETGKSGDPTCPLYGNKTIAWSGPVTGTTTALSFLEQSVSTNGSYVQTNKATFSGTLAGGTVAGTLTMSWAGSGVLPNATFVTQSGASTMTVTLR